MSSLDAARRGDVLDLSDRLNFERLRAGDHAAFEALFRRYAAALCALAHRYVGSTAVAEELTQDLFCWLWGHRVGVAVPGSVRAYLFASLRNRALNHVRHERITLEFGDRSLRQHSGATGVDAADASLLADDLTAALENAVRSMPLRCREVFSLVRDDHLSYAEVADVLGISAKTVEIHMSRALALLRDQLAPWILA
ncbi:MAG: RNA polymerase sigma-70 factor [bacterium]